MAVMENLFVFIALVITSVTATDSTPIVMINSGPIQGKVLKFNGTDVYHFLGIPYAEPPLGKLRFRRPIEPKKWTSIRTTKEYGKACIQRNPDIPTPMTSEDCLILNVIVNRKTFEAKRFGRKSKLRPVMVWLHGGAMVQGSGGENFGGNPLVPLHDIVLVTLNYRLNAFGFMYFGPDEPRIGGNMGLWDQNLALQWVRKNIHLFGGDRECITLFGESAGAMSASAHVLSPVSKGLFHRAILESGSIQFPVSKETIDEHVIGNSYRVLNRTTCLGTKDILACLQTLDAATLLDCQGDGILRFTWIFGDELLPNHPEEAFPKRLYNHQIDLLIGAEKDEFSIFMPAVDPKSFDPMNPQDFNYTHALELLSILFIPEGLEFYRDLYFGPRPTNDSAFLRQQLIKAYGDANLFCTTYLFGVNFMQGSSDPSHVYAYYHTQKPKHSTFPICDTSPWMGICHTSEIPHVYGLPFRYPGRYSDDDVTLSWEMMKIWTHFAENGEMLPVKGHHWNRLNKSDLSAMVMNANQLGTKEIERIRFCVDQWPNFLKYSSKQILSVLAFV